MIDPADLAGLAGPGPASAPRSDQEAAEAFETMLVKMLLAEVKKTMPDAEGPFAALSGVFDQALAERIVAGGGLGLARDVAPRLGEADEAPAPPRPPESRPARSVQPRITSMFGHRSDPFDGHATFHKGIDIGVPTGTPVQALRDGRVVHAGTFGTGGNVVIVDHGDGLQTRYAHCSELHVEVGQVVRQGDVIAASGSTGRSTGPHLHVEVRRDGVAEDPLLEFPDLVP